MIRKCYACGKTIMSDALLHGWRAQTLYWFDVLTQVATAETRFACSDACADKTFQGWTTPAQPVPSASTTVEG